MSAVVRAAPVRGPLARGLLGLTWAWVFVVVLLPMLSLLWAGLRSPGPITAALVRSDVLYSLGLTLVITLLTVAFTLVFGAAGGIVLVRGRLPGRRLLDAAIDLPLAVSPVMIGLAFLLLIGRQGLFGPTLSALGVQIAFAPLGVLIGTLFVTLPLTVREVAVLLEELGTSEEEAAATLGATRWQALWWVTLPNLREALVGGTLLTVARSLGEFGAVLVLGGAIAMRTSTATTSIHLAIEERDLPVATGLSLLLAAASISLVTALRRRGGGA